MTLADKHAHWVGVICLACGVSSDSDRCLVQAMNFCLLLNA